MDIKQDEAWFQIGSTVKVVRGLTVAARAYTYTLREIRGREAMIDNGIPSEPSLADCAFSVAAWVPLRDLEPSSGPLRLSAAAQVALARREERAQADARVQALQTELAQLRTLKENIEALHAGLMGDRAAMLRHSALQDRLAFPLESVLRHSADAIEHLFQAHDCDAHGHEVWREAGIVAAIMADTIGGDHGR